jgi:GT2 family glycosyltransferase
VYRRDWFLETGGFDPGFFMYCEDVDLSQRAHRRGWELLLVPAAVFEHHRALIGPKRDGGYACGPCPTPA